MHKLKEWLFSKNISVRDFAQVLNISEHYLYNISTGCKIPGERLAFIIEKKTGIPMTYWNLKKWRNKNGKRTGMETRKRHVRHRVKEIS